jgi:predicted amidophosphoribosyltransferase
MRLILDDAMTTESTLHAATTALLDAGAEALVFTKEP